MQTGGKIYFVDSVDVIKTRLSVGTSVKRTVCLLTGDIEAEDLQAIEVTGAKVITGMTLSQERDRFLKLYIDLMAEVGLSQPDKWWWATDFSSKIVFVTGIPELLEQLFVALEAMKQDDGADLIIVSPPWPLLPVLAREAGERLVTGWRRRYLQARLVHVLRSRMRWPFIVGRECVRLACRAVFARMVLGRKPVRLPEDDCIVVRSNASEKSFGASGEYKDIFLGGLVARILARGPAVIITDVIGGYRATLSGMQRSKEPVLPWEYFLGLGDVWRYSLKLLVWRPRRVVRATMAGCDVSGVMNDELASTAVFIQPRQFFQYPAALRMARRLHIGRLITIFEGNAWCKMLVSAVRAERPGVRVVGYQHAIVPQAFGNMYFAALESGKTPLPDVIMTVGQEARNIMVRYSGLPDGVIQAACAFRQAPMPESPCKRRAIRKVLVALEGVDEARHLISYVLEQLAGVREVEVAFRFHPVLPAEYFERKYGFSFSANANVSVSSGSLAQAIESADVLVYCSTTVSLEALMVGKPVVHFHGGVLLSLDPLFACPHHKWVVTRDKSLIDVFRQIDDLSDTAFRNGQDQARAYIRRYFEPVRDEVVERFFSA